MHALIADVEQLTRFCREADAQAGPQALVDGVNGLMPELDFHRVLTRGNWHRLGGVVDGAYGRISDNIVHWASEVSGGDVDELIAAYVDKGWFATQLSGKTHFFTASCGENPEDFIQIEIEELQEVLDRPLVERDWFPDSLEEFLDPLDYPRLEHEPIGQTYYQFRRITPVAELLRESRDSNQEGVNLRRFFQDWRQSSAFEGFPLCRHWVLALREYMDTDGEYRLKARPLSAFDEGLPDPRKGEDLQGARLANAIHGYDRRLGYPFAWFFNMLSRQSANYALAQAVLRDQAGAYDYLPARDLKILRAWEERPYAV